MIDETFKENSCLLPWVCFSIYSGNNCKVCCSSSIPYGLADKVTDINHTFHDKFQEIREAFLKGAIPLTCRSCYKIESFGMRSRRVRFKEWMYDYFDEDIPKLQYLDINFSNTCNLNCVMCSSEFSTKWNEFDKKTTLSFRKHAKPFAKHTKLTKSFIDQVNIKDLKLVEVKGGEPLIDPGFIYFIDRFLSENGDAYIHLTTNLTILKDDVRKRLEMLPKLAVDVSVDGVGYVYKYIRGTELQPVRDHLYCLSTFKNIDKLRVNITTSPYNLWDSYKIVHWTHTTNPENIEVNWCPMTLGPFYLAPSLIPHKLRLEAVQILDQMNWSDKYKIDLDVTKNYLTKENPENLSKKRLEYVRECFIKWTDEMNKIRGLNIYEIVPQLQKARNIILK